MINLIPFLITENKAAIEIFILQKFLYKPSNYQGSLCSLKKIAGCKRAPEARPFSLSTVIVG